MHGFAHILAPVEHKSVELLRTQVLFHENVTLFQRNNVKRLVKKPNRLRRRCTVIEVKQHLKAFEQEFKVKIWWNHQPVLMNSAEPRSRHLHGFYHGERVVHMRF